MPSFTLHNQWGSFHWSPGHRDQLHKPPAVLLVTFVLLLLLCAVGYFLSPVVQKATQCRGSFPIICRQKCVFLFLWILLDLLDERSWPVLPKIRVWGRSPGSQSEHWNGVAERRFFFYIGCRIHTQSGDFLWPEPSDVMHYSAGNITTCRDPYGIQ